MREGGTEHTYDLFKQLYYDTIRVAYDVVCCNVVRCGYIAAYAVIESNGIVIFGARL